MNHEARISPAHPPSLDAGTARPAAPFPTLDPDRRLRETSQRRAWPALVLIVSALAIWWVPLGLRWLHGPDEGRYAEIAREMLSSGDWVTPRLNGILYFEKPPLVYWATALAFKLAGLNEFAARIWPALSALLPLPPMWWVVRRSFDARTATASVAILASSLWWIANGHFLTLDMSLSAFMTIGMLMVWAANLPDTNERQAVLRMRIAWIAVALAVLSKGVVALVVPAAGLGAYVLATGDRQVLRRLSWFEGGLILFSLCGPWFLLMETHNPGFLKFFFIHEHLQRFTSTIHRRSGPLYYFIPILIVGAFPWTSFLPSLRHVAWRRRTAGLQVERFLTLQALVIFGFFSVSGSKLPSYILPMFPPLAVLLAVRLQAVPAPRIGRHLLASTGVLAALTVIAGVVMTRGTTASTSAGVGGFAISVAFGLALLGGCGAWLSRWRADAPSTHATLAAAMAALACSQIAIGGYQYIEAQRSPVRWLAQAAPHLGPSTPIYSVDTYDQTLPFYLRRPVTLVAYVDEFETGLRREPQRQIPTLAAFAERWRDEPGAVAILSREAYELLTEAGSPMTPIAGDRRRVLVRQPGTQSR
ncbi:MAG: glycosyltransferase family 39 protein [Burkholderiaceae bacterium]